MLTLPPRESRPVVDYNTYSLIRQISNDLIAYPVMRQRITSRGIEVMRIVGVAVDAENTLDASDLLSVVPDPEITEMIPAMLDYVRVVRDPYSPTVRSRLTNTRAALLQQVVSVLSSPTQAGTFLNEKVTAALIAMAKADSLLAQLPVPARSQRDLNTLSKNFFKYAARIVTDYLIVCPEADNYPSDYDAVEYARLSVRDGAVVLASSPVPDDPAIVAELQPMEALANRLFEA